MEQPLPFDDAYFDIIVCCEGIEHVFSPFNLFSEFARVLKDGGILVITTPNVQNLYSRWQFLCTGYLFQFDPFNKIPLEHGIVGDKGHISPVTYGQLRYYSEHFKMTPANPTGGRFKRIILLPLLAPILLIGFWWNYRDWRRTSRVTGRKEIIKTLFNSESSSVSEFNIYSHTLTSARHQSVSPMRRQDFSYELPKQLIANMPPENRVDSRLMVIDPMRPIAHRTVSDLPSMIREGDVVVANNTRVFPARLLGAKVSGGRIEEVMIERLLSDHAVRAFVKASKAPKEGTKFLMDGGFELIVKGRDVDLFIVESDPATSILDMAEAHGHIPLPPYIQRDDTAQDRERYQTVFAKNSRQLPPLPQVFIWMSL